MTAKQIPLIKTIASVVGLLAGIVGLLAFADGQADQAYYPKLKGEQNESVIKEIRGDIRDIKASQAEISEAVIRIDER